jgi:hypothetical protein
MEQEMKEMRDKQEQEKREADTKREALQSSKDKTAISKVKKGKAKATTIGKAKQTPKTPPAQETHTPDAVQARGAVREHLVELPGEEWTVHSHYVHEDGRLMFGVDMYGIPLEPGEGWDYGEKGLLAIDGAKKSVTTYIKEKANYPPWSTLLLPTRPSQKAKSLVEPEEVKTVECRHDVYDEGFTYREEGNPAYCKDGFYMAGLRCGGCDRKFVPDKKTELKVGKDVSFRPKPSAAVYCCVNIEQNSGGNSECNHAFCAVCWNKRLKESMSNDEDGGRQNKRRKRGA